MIKNFKFYFRHVELVLKEDGIYASMWKQQLESANSEDTVKKSDSPRGPRRPDAVHRKTKEELNSDDTIGKSDGPKGPRRPEGRRGPREPSSGARDKN